jgi:pimeloyl-ACP methyl ester carboxylesterase
VFVRVSGPGDAPPLVLLPSAAASSLFWIPNIEALSQSRRVYAVDNLHDFGRSVSRAPARTVRDHTDWLEALFDALGLQKDVSLAGLSYGAWLAAQFALRAPGRLRALVLMAPPATVRQLPLRWAWHGLTGLLPHRYFLRSMTRWMFPVLSRRTDAASCELTESLIDDAFLGLRSYRLRIPVAPTVLTDDELRALSEVPTLFLVGEHEVIYPAEEAVRRLQEVAPAIRTQVIPGAGHDLTLVQARLVNDLIVEFLDRGR